MNRDDELAREIREHLELEAEELVADGEPPDRARDAARRAFGNITRVREDARAVWIPPWIDQCGQDLRYAFRRLRRSPGIAASAILILTVGVGLNLGFFQLLNVIAFRPLPVAGLDTLVRFDRVARNFSSNGLPYPATQFIREHNAVLSAVLTSSSDDVVWEDDPNDRLDALYVSANWFHELGYGAAQGRMFAETIDERPDAAAVIVVSHRFWQHRLNAGPVVGRTVRVNNRVATIVGVVPAGFTGLRLADTDIWLPINQIDYFNSGIGFKDDWGSHNTQLYGRLRPGISAAAVRDGLQPTIAELARVRPGDFATDESLVPYSGRERFRGPRDRAELATVAFLVSGLTLTILIVACANLSNLVLTQTLSRLREFGLRRALGASRGRILRQHLVEVALLVVIGSAAGVVLGTRGAQYISDYFWMPQSADLRPDWRTAVAGCALASVAVVFVGLLPAWSIGRRDLSGALKEGGHQMSTTARARFRLGLIGCQVAGCCVLLIVTGSTWRGVQRMLSGDVGFDFAPVAVLDPSLSRYGIQGGSATTYWREVTRRLEATMEIEQFALASHSPFGSPRGRSVYGDAPSLSVSTLRVEPSFFPVLRIPIVAGRTFQPDDPSDSVAIISRTLALGMYGTLDVVGKGFPKSRPDRTIVGVAGDAHLANVTANTVAELYQPADSGRDSGLVLLARARTSADRLLVPLADAARRADSRVLPRTWLPNGRFAEQARARQLAMALAGLAALLALGLACFGLFALVSQNVSLRAKEIGIRRALGADARSVLTLILRQLALPLTLGALVGLLGGAAAAGLLEGEPFFLPPMDVLTPVAALLLFALTAGFAGLVPALRALGTEPLGALRQE